MMSYVNGSIFRLIEQFYTYSMNSADDYYGQIPVINLLWYWLWVWKCEVKSVLTWSDASSEVYMNLFHTVE